MAMGINYCSMQYNMDNVTVHNRGHLDDKEEVVGEKIRIKQILFRLCANACLRMNSGNILLQNCILSEGQLLKIKSYFVSLLSSPLGTDINFVVFIVTDRGVPIKKVEEVNMHNTTNRVKREKLPEFEYLNPILSRIDANLWVKSNSYGTSFLLAAPLQSMCTHTDAQLQAEIDLIAQD
jgi:hypothetical protein